MTDPHSDSPVKENKQAGKHMFVFPGKDASLAFVTGDFTESGLTDDVSSLSPLQVLALFDWLAFYQRTYTAVGMRCSASKCVCISKMLCTASLLRFL